MNAEDLRFFLAVRQAGSIKGAARALKVDHSTVSRRLAALEEALDARLFERTPEGLLETDVAQAIAPLAERIELLRSELKDAASAASDSPRGPVRIAVSPVMGAHFLIPRVPELGRRFPETALEILADVSAVSIPQREADVAIRQYPRGRPPAEPSALAMKVGSFGFAAYASPAYVDRRGRPERPIRSLEGHEMISTARGGPGNTWNEQLEHPARYVLSGYPFSVTSAAAAAGIGIAVLPCLGTDADPRLLRLTDVVASYDVWVVTNHTVRNNLRVRAVKDALVEMLRSADAELSGAAGGKCVSADPG
jgi:DNA-binding transcriptional LysR family regulator